MSSGAKVEARGEVKNVGRSAAGAAVGVAEGERALVGRLIS